MARATLFSADCLFKLKEIKSNSIDSLVTDPPAGIAFMGKEWDKDKGGRDGWISWIVFGAFIVLTKVYYMC